VIVNRKTNHLDWELGAVQAFRLLGVVLALRSSLVTLFESDIFGRVGMSLQLLLL